MGFEKTTSQILFDNGVHKCISFTSLVKGGGIQANQFLITVYDWAIVINSVRLIGMLKSRLIRNI